MRAWALGLAIDRRAFIGGAMAIGARWGVREGPLALRAQLDEVLGEVERTRG
jgi:hypothetical protein